MIKKISKRLVLIILVTFVLVGFTNSTHAILLPEKDINIKLNNFTTGSELHLLIPEDLLRYNMEKTITYNKENPYEVEAEEVDKLENFLKKKDYIGYMEHYKSLGYQVEKNEVELRHYCFSLGEAEILDYEEIDKNFYVDIRVNVNDNNEFKLILKDYLLDYDATKIKFKVYEFGSNTYIDLTGKKFAQNPQKPNITECNVIFEPYSEEEYLDIERKIGISYSILYIILAITLLIILDTLYRKHKKKKMEIEERKFWKKKLTKQEKKEEKKRLKEEKKLNKKRK